jgi:LemA protein
MKTSLIAVILVAALLLGFGLFYLYGAGVRDKAVERQETVKQTWSDVQGAYQRRADLIGNLVETVRAAAQNEKEILIGVTEARGGIRHYTDSLGHVVAEQQQAVRNANSPAQLEQSDMVLMNTYKGFRGFMTENYPTINSTQNFSTLQAQLEGTENRINTERNRYNEAVKDYNSYIRGTWREKGIGLVSKPEDNFKTMEGFEAKEDAEDAPVVKF